MTLTQLAKSYLNSSTTSKYKYQSLIDKCNDAIEAYEEGVSRSPSVNGELHAFVAGTEWENKPLPEHKENEPFWKEFDEYYNEVTECYKSYMDELKAKKCDAEEALKILANRGI